MQHFLPQRRLMRGEEEGEVLGASGVPANGGIQVSQS